MIDQLLSRRETVPYALAGGSIILGVILGYLFGHQDPTQMCSSYIVEAERTTNQALECTKELTTCRATKAGESVIDCGLVCTQRVEKALKDHKAIVCED
tara:strand:+ start:701 stop:997 length:297 start_codon:yes stop_codon:yes gene_type:complete